MAVVNSLHVSHFVSHCVLQGMSCNRSMDVFPVLDVPAGPLCPKSNFMSKLEQHWQRHPWVALCCGSIMYYVTQTYRTLRASGLGTIAPLELGDMRSWECRTDSLTLCNLGTSMPSGRSSDLACPCHTQHRLLQRILGCGHKLCSINISVGQWV